jgi:hypothetical protein
VDAAELLAARHAAHVLAAHQAMARIRQALMRPDLAAVLLADALAALEAAAVPRRVPPAAAGGMRSRQTDERRAYDRERKRRQRERLKAAAEP